MVEQDYTAIQRAQLPEALRQSLIGNYLLYSDILKTAVEVRKQATANHSELFDRYEETHDPEVKRAMHATGKTIAKALQQVDHAETMLLSCEVGLGCLEAHNRRNKAA